MVVLGGDFGTDVAGIAGAQTCLTADEMDAPTRNSLITAGQQFFDWTRRATWRRCGRTRFRAWQRISAASKRSQGASNFAGAPATARPPFLLQAEGRPAGPRRVPMRGFRQVGADGEQCRIRDSEFAAWCVRYRHFGCGRKAPSTLSFVLQKMGNDWKLGGVYSRPTQVRAMMGMVLGPGARVQKERGESQRLVLLHQSAGLAGARAIHEHNGDGQAVRRDAISATAGYACRGSSRGDFRAAKSS